MDDKDDEQECEKNVSGVRRKGKVSRRKLVKRPKVRGTYKGSKAPISLGDRDLAECIFSDDDVLAGYLDDNAAPIDEISGRPQQEPVGHFTSVECSSCTDTSDSRPSSAAESSRPESSLGQDLSLPSDLDSRPSSVASSVASSSEPGPSKIQMSPAFEIASVLGAIIPQDQQDVQCDPSLNCIQSCLDTFRAILPQQWAVICDRNSFHLLLMSESTPKAVQREVVIYFSGKVSIYVHCKTIMNKKVLLNDPVPPLLFGDADKVQVFCEKSVKIVRFFMEYGVCVGADHEPTESVWSTLPGTFIDLNPYNESDFPSKTCRSLDCDHLVKLGKGKSKKSPRCAPCSNIYNQLKKREEFLTSDTAHSHTPNIFLTPAQTVKKLVHLQEESRKKDRKINYLEKKVEKLLANEGVEVESHISAALAHILQSSELSEIQKVFLKQQLDCSKNKDARSNTWHPTMIRFALFLKDKMTGSGYEALRDSGAIKLPHSRTLFDYSHAIATQEGVSDGILKHVSEKVCKLPKSYQKYHNVLCDEMYVSRNLVYRKGDHSLVGYEKLNEVEKEMKEFECHIESMFSGTEVRPKKPQLARTILAFLVKGIASDVKYLVAAFPMKDLKADHLYVRSWQVIMRLEKAGIKVIAFVCDGAATNRSFINMHTPFSKSHKKGGIIFDTVNFCSPEGRPLFFISDVCHLLKTIRNCLHNSGDGPKKTRLMKINGEYLQWKTILRLYYTYKRDNFRKSYKLNLQSVHPNSYSCMSVKNAANVLSDTVAQDIEEQALMDPEGWQGTTELVRFIRYVNKFFDCLNGAFSSHGTRTRNPNLAPYCDVDDPRFDWLGVPNPKRDVPKHPSEQQPFLDYLQDWKKQVYALPIDPKKKAKHLLSEQSLDGIEITIKGFAGAVRYLLELEEPPQFINARVFSQDPIEQHFSVQRAGGGGNRNPNTQQFLSKQVSVTVQKDIGVRARKSNATETGKTGMEVTEEPLPKRRKPPPRKK